MLKSIVLPLICCLVIHATAFAQAKRVNLKAGGFVEGTVSEVDGKYRVETRFGPITVTKDQVLSIVEVITPRQEYQQRLGQIDPNSAEDHFKLGEWAMNKQLLDIAQKELQTALKLKKDHQMAALMLREVQAKLKLAKAKAKPPVIKPTDGVVGLGAVTVESGWLLTDEEIQRVRLEELRANDNVVVRFRGNVLNRFMDMMQGKGDFESRGFANEFRTFRPVRKAIYILDNINHENTAIKDDILIKSDPRFMLEFRSRIWPIIASHCAMAACHGGQEPFGKLRLFNIRGKNEKVDYTNFLILESFSTDGRKLIDRDHKELSLLLQYGLPPGQAKDNHPMVFKDLKPAYTTRNARNYLRVLEWIESLKGPPHPDYRVTLRIPWAPKSERISLPPDIPAATPQPTTQPLR